jgi:MraZ protein
MWVFVGESGEKWDAGKTRRLAIKTELEQMFLGQYTHSVDNKGRLTIPVRFREYLADGAIISQGFERNLMVLTTSAFEQMSERVNGMSMTDPIARQLRRLIFATADRAELDRSGRILIPQFLREITGLEGEAVIVGAGEYFEVWSPEAWLPLAEDLQDTDVNAGRFTELEISSSQVHR